MFDKILKSSHNPDNVSLSVKGVLMNVVGIIILIGGSAVDSGILTGLVEQISAIVGTLALLVGQLQVAYGLVRKLWSPKLGDSIADVGI